MDTQKKAVFAGGCFWCMVAPFEAKPGVTKVLSGYIGGKKPNPTYEEVSMGNSGHIEAVEITYDPAKVSYQELVDIFWKQIDPTDEFGQFADKGSQYITAIFYNDENEKKIAEASKEVLAKSGKFNKPIKTKIIAATPFYPAEDYHQDYHKKNPMRYQFYRSGSGREEFLHETWGDKAK
ncbi:peptide-methionine (S)-S-oxide reductase MsrA [bacterium]|nr:peptide-methionine (S)-S-oxide reductase MsrA [bacterium]